jgi:predicted dienelactone hydrolase
MIWWTVACIAAALAPLMTPAMTGTFPVGRTHIVWRDSTRNQRPVRVDLWYPARSASAGESPYLPDLARLWANADCRRSVAEFFDTTAVSRIRQIQAQATDEAEIAETVHPFPLLVFSPGLGLSPYLYSAQLEDLASHGYIVAGIEHPEDTLAAVLPDGSVLPFDAALWSRHPAVEGEAQFYAARAELLAQDISFVISQLLALSHQSSSMWHNKIDEAHLGAFGHSQGGRVAGAACLLDRRIRACLNEDGQFDPSQRPYTPIPGLRIEGNFAMLDWFDPGFEPSDFAAMRTTLIEYSKLRLRPNDAALRAYEDVEGGSFRLTLLTRGMSHLSFSDQPYLRAVEGQRQGVLARLAAVRAIVRGFFDEAFDRADGSLHCGEVSAGALVQCFPPHRRGEKPEER